MSDLGKFLPAPTGYTRSQAEDIVRKASPEGRTSAIVDLLRPAIRIWPIPSSGKPKVSRFGGLPSVPPGWTWPFVGGKPLVFLAQIDCAEVRATCGRNTLPESGLLSFFGGYDDIMGCGPTDGGVVFHFADAATLQVGSHPETELEPRISCDLSFYSHTEIPDPQSRVVRSLGFSKEEYQRYCDLYDHIAKAGFADHWYDDWISKLLGWPDQVQHEFFRPWSSGDILLLQVGRYPDGNDVEGWGPGGRVYFTIASKDLAAGRFDTAELEVQTT